MKGILTSAGLEHLLRAERQRPLVFATVGSDHHRFDRLVRWLDAWMDDRPGVADCVVQFGTASRPRSCLGIDYVDHDLLQLCLSSSDITVVQGGPMSIVESRRAGRRPIVVPRIARLDEVVDDHQVTFCRKLAAPGLITLAEDDATLRRCLDAAIRDPDDSSLRRAGASRSPESIEAVARVRRTAGLIVAKRRHHAEPTVLLLGGTGRSGTTLLERLLAEAPSVTALGETLHLWERGLDANELCGCGERFSDCPFWNKIGIEAFGGWDRLDTGRAVALRRTVVRSRHVAGLLGLPAKPSWRLDREVLARMVTRLYQGSAVVANAPVLVDSSKHPAYAMLLRRAAVDLRCALVVRDPRAVAYSWQRSVRRPEVVGRDTRMPRYGLVRTALTWDLYALLYQTLRMLRVPVMVVRYEDLVRDPEQVVRSTLRFAGARLDDATASSMSARSVELGVAHTVAGNPMRFDVGQIALRPDDEWRTGLGPRQQRLVAALTAPVRRVHGYR